MGHYLTTVPNGCLCHYTQQRIPGEPHMPTYLDGEPNIECPVHFTDLDRARDVIGVLVLLLTQGALVGSDDREHTLTMVTDGDGWDEPYSLSAACDGCSWEVSWVQQDPRSLNRPSDEALVRDWMRHVWPRP